MLKSKSKDVQRNAAKVLALLAKEPSIRVSIVDEGAVSPLLDLLIDPVALNSMAACKALLCISVCVKFITVDTALKRFVLLTPA
jgi:hypothetical protein